MTVAAMAMMRLGSIVYVLIIGVQLYEHISVTQCANLQSLSRMVTLTRGGTILTVSRFGTKSMKKTSSVSGLRSSIIVTSKHRTRVVSLNGSRTVEIVS